MKITKNALLLSILALLFALPALASPAPVSKEDPIDTWLAKAIEKDYSTAGMRNATNDAREMWNKEMNKVYSRLMSRLSKSQQGVLRDSQRTWLKFRDSEGEVISHVVASKDGTMYQLMATSMGMELVKARTLQLREYEASLDE